jgi:hypothetical protein
VSSSVDDCTISPSLTGLQDGLVALLMHTDMDWMASGAAWAVRKYQSHRVLPESLMRDLDAAKQQELGSNGV